MSANDARRRAIVATLLAAFTATSVARSQDFVAGLPAGPDDSPLVWIERGLPGSSSGLRADAAVTRWFGLESFATHAGAFGGGWRTLRVAAGLSRTGDRELGWNAAGLAAGGANAVCGAAARAVVRRDLEFRGARTRDGAGLEAGGGAWMRVGSSVRAWASAPQLWLSGAAPPAPRPLEIGAALEVDGTRLWVARRAPTDRGLDAGGRVLGAGLAGAPGRAWIEARDRPLRGALGGAARVRGLVVSAVVEGHPVLGETVTIAIAVIPLEHAP
jgi:hypothetical protein